MSTVMLAEDDLTMISLLQTLLSMEGYQVIALGSDEDVFEAVCRENPNLLLLDVHLPTVNGLDVLDKLRQNPETKNVSVVMTSGLDLGTECLDRGANDFLLKPYMPDDLLVKIKDNLKLS